MCVLTHTAAQSGVKDRRSIGLHPVSIPAERLDGARRSHWVSADIYTFLHLC